MKTSPISFLFLCAFFCSNNSYIAAQTEKDSVRYYYSLATNPTKSTDLIDSYIFFKIDFYINHCNNKINVKAKIEINTILTSKIKFSSHHHFFDKLNTVDKLFFLITTYIYTRHRVNSYLVSH